MILKYKTGKGLALLAMTLVLFVFTCLADSASAATSLAVPAGVVEKLERTLTATRDGVAHELTQGSKVYSFDVIKTGMIGYALIRLIDNTFIELGSSSVLNIVDIAFNARSSRLHVALDHGSARVRTGSIGLKDKYGINITTPRSIVTSSNSVLFFIVQPDEERMDVEWLPAGPTVSVYNVNTGKTYELMEPLLSLLTGPLNEVAIEKLNPAE
ncbi:MAG: FecR family protein [Synergistaceae bacterium]|jgi:hypothetical protein|nr:FecR family protein [Synergistaceae bacterium]